MPITFTHLLKQSLPTGQAGPHGPRQLTPPSGINFLNKGAGRIRTCKSLIQTEVSQPAQRLQSACNCQHNPTGFSVMLVYSASIFRHRAIIRRHPVLLILRTAFNVADNVAEWCISFIIIFFHLYKSSRPVPQIFIVNL